MSAANLDDRQPASKIVAIAASAGGIKAIASVIGELPADFPAAIAIVQHLSRQVPSLLPEIFARQTALKVKQAEVGDLLVAGQIYVAPPDYHLIINGDRTLSLTQTELVHHVRPSAELLFESAAYSYRENAIAIVLTGTDRDGSLSVQTIKQMGGTVIAQCPATAEYQGMPQSTLDTGAVDLLLPIGEISSNLIRLIGSTPKIPMAINEEDRLFEALLEYLRQVRGFDFTGYKPSSLKRRIRKQMQVRGLETFGDYLDYLEVHPEEFSALFNTVLINVTGFFRDPEAWKYLDTQILSAILAQKTPDLPIRVWSAGCASGEEAYTLAMLLAEHLDIEQFRQRVKIYATDADEEALAQARQASYEAKAVEAIPTALLERYFDVVTGRYVFRADLRRAVIFGRHDLVQDAPISRLDLLVCRNTLMYFNAETQKRILSRFHFALNESGALFLGKAEMLLTHSSLFTPLSLQHRIFSRVARVSPRDRLLVLAQTGDEEAGNRLAINMQLREAAFNSVPIAQIVVDFNGTLAMANSLARSLFRINLQDIGKPLQDLEISYRPVELRSHIEKVYSDRAPVLISNVQYAQPEKLPQFLDVQITPLQSNSNGYLGVSISFIDVTGYHELQAELHRYNQELETANEELQSSNEELETTNEELQSTNEELETTNEELQSTNEELETMNEELQSTNEELQTINDELRIRTVELNQTNAFLNSILSSLRGGVVVIDRQYNVLTWNGEAENLWGLRAEEVQGHSLFSLDIGLPVEHLGEPIRNCLVGGEKYQETILQATNRRGRAIQCRVSITPLNGHEESQRRGVILLMEEIES